MFVKKLIILCTVVFSTFCQNSTNDLEVRVTLLEDDVEDLEGGLLALQDEVEEVETDINQHDDRLNIMEQEINDNGNDIDDLYANADETAGTIASLQQQVAQLEATNTLLLQRVNTLEAVTNSTNHNLVALTSDVAELDNSTDVRLTQLQERIEDLEEGGGVGPWVACESSPCDNGGTCIDVNVDTFICMCRDGLFGVTCSESYADTSFLAAFDYDPGTPTDPIVWNVAPLNPGGHYDVTSGIYTVPVDGVYEFNYHVKVFGDPGFNAFLEVDNVQVFRGHSSEGTYLDPFLQVTVLVSLTAGQQVWVSPSSLDYMVGTPGTYYESWFAGHLVYPV